MQISCRAPVLSENFRSNPSLHNDFCKVMIFMNVIGISGLANSFPFKKRKMPGLSAREYYVGQGFDAAAALVTEQGILAAAAEERFTGEKATGAFPVNAIRYCLKAGNL